GKLLCDSLNLDFLGKIPIDPTFVELIEMQDSDTSGKNLLELYETSNLRPVMAEIVEKVLAKNLPSRLSDASMAETV
ncbi:hypothetical protein OXX59_010220, partial [Metschnikowia pulcherrima]